MSRTCDFCGKKTATGNKLSRRGLAKKKGGIGIKLTGITKRKFKPNIQKIKIETPEGEVKHVKICTRCLKSGNILKPKNKQKK